jgi:hypothetical protein
MHIGPTPYRDISKAARFDPLQVSISLPGILSRTNSRSSKLPTHSPTKYWTLACREQAQCNGQSKPSMVVSTIRPLTAGH